MSSAAAPPVLPDLDVLEVFEQRWRSDQPPSIDAFWRDVLASHVPLVPAARRPLLHDLVLLDIEFRSRIAAASAEDTSRQDAKIGLPPLPLEEYVTLLPELGPLADLPLLLVVEDYRARRLRGESPPHESYAERFGPRAAEVRAALALTEAKLAGHVESTLRLDSAHSYAGAPLGIAPPGYEIVHRLGEGGMGVVYKARETRLDRFVALKLIRAGIEASSEDLARFHVEATAIARLKHPNITQIYTFGDLGGRPYLVLEFADGGSLQERVAGQPWPVRSAAALVQTLAWAIHHAHEEGIVHRDLKPANILLMLEGGEVQDEDKTLRTSSTSFIFQGSHFTPKITDFGLAKLLEGEGPGPTCTQAVLGTPPYMAPEQAEGRSREVGRGADIYSLGAILYLLLTGRPPFVGENPMDTLDQVRSQAPVPPTRLQPKVPRDLETICLKCLEKEPHKRYASAAALAEDLQRFLDNRPIRARRTGLAERAWRWCRRRPLDAALIAGMGLIVLGAFVTILWQLHRVEAMNNQLLAKNQELDTARRGTLKNKKDLSDAYFGFYRDWWHEGHLENARRATQKIEMMWPEDAFELYNVACQWSYLSRLFDEPDGVAPESRMAESEFCGQDAVRVLNRSFNKGFMALTDLIVVDEKAGKKRRITPVAQIMLDRDLNPLRARGDFKRLLRRPEYKSALEKEAETLEKDGNPEAIRRSALRWAYLVYALDVPEDAVELRREKDRYASNAVSLLRRVNFRLQELAELPELAFECHYLWQQPEFQRTLNELGQRSRDAQ